MMKFAFIALFAALLGCAGMATPPQNGCGTRFASWCVSKYIHSNMITDSVNGEINLIMNVDNHEAKLKFSNLCSTGSFTGFKFSREIPLELSDGSHETSLGWISNEGNCIITISRDNFDNDKYNDIARKIHYYLILIGNKGTLNMFPFN